MPSTERTERTEKTGRGGNGTPIPLDLLYAVGPGAPSKADKLRLVQSVRQIGGTAAAALDEFLIDHLTATRGGLLEAQACINELKEVVGQLTAPPLIPARFLGRHPTQPLAEVVAHNNRAILPVAKEVDLDALLPGQEVVLNQKMALVLGPNPVAPGMHGQTGTFQRMLGEGRMAIRTNGDEEMILGIAAFAAGPWRLGDCVRYDPAAGLALENIPRDETAGEFLAPPLPDLTREMFGGQRENLDKLIAALTLAATQPDAARRYALGGAMRTILLSGPPGTGKSYLARIAASHLQQVTGRKCHLSIAKPGQFEDPYVGVTQRRIRQCFKAMRQHDGVGLLFIDEIESIGRSRGGAGNHHGDKFLGALLAEIQGMEPEGKNPCAVIAATNRPDMLDPALLSRMELQLSVGRPDARAAREIFSIHLPDDLPFHNNGHPGSAERQRILDRAVSLFYAPNAAGPLAVIKFRDGSQRPIAPADLASGRCFEQVCRAARQAAAFREVAGGQAGLVVRDIEDAVADAQASLASSLTRQNIHQHLGDLRQDMEVVAVEVAVKRVKKPHRFLNPA